MELVNWQYSGSKHDKTKGIDVVNALWWVSAEQHKSTGFTPRHGDGRQLVGKSHQQLREIDIPDEGLVTNLKGYGWVRVFRFVAKQVALIYLKNRSRSTLNFVGVSRYYTES